MIEADPRDPEDRAGVDGDFIGASQRSVRARVAGHLSDRLVKELRSGDGRYTDLSLLRFVSDSAEARSAALDGLSHGLGRLSPPADTIETCWADLEAEVLSSLRASSTIPGTQSVRTRLGQVEALLIHDFDAPPDRPATWEQVQLVLAEVWRSGTWIASSGRRSLSAVWFNVSSGWLEIPL